MLKRFFSVACATLIALTVLAGCSGKSDEEIIQSYIDSNQEALDADLGDQVEVEVTAEDNKLICTFKLLEDYGELESSMVSEFGTLFPEDSDDSAQVIQELKDAGVKSPVFEINLKNQDGEVIFTRQYT